MKSILLVMAGGAVGAALRFQLGRMLSVDATGWPWHTFAANVVGGFAMGILASWLARMGTGGNDLRLLLGVGLLGGFTTFSAFSLEMALMVERGQLALAAGYALASVVLALAALFAGMGLMRAVAA
jgi:fluoride exporter